MNVDSLESPTHHISDHPSFGLHRDDTEDVDRLIAHDKIIAMRSHRVKKHLGYLAGLPLETTVDAIARIHHKRNVETQD